MKVVVKQMSTILNEKRKFSWWTDFTSTKQKLHHSCKCSNREIIPETYLRGRGLTTWLNTLGHPVTFSHYFLVMTWAAPVQSKQKSCIPLRFQTNHSSDQTFHAGCSYTCHVFLCFCLRSSTDFVFLFLSFFSSIVITTAKLYCFNVLHSHAPAVCSKPV